MNQLPLSELLKDPLYRSWIQKLPPPKPAREGFLPWRVYVRFEGKPWAFRDFRKYSQAFNWLMPRLKFVEDAAIHSKVAIFKPPVVKDSLGVKHYWPSPPGHRWCSLCRRPTVFCYFSKHHIRPNGVSPYERRCTICGVRETSDLVKRFHTTIRSRWSRAGEKGGQLFQTTVNP